MMKSNKFHYIESGISVQSSKSVLQMFHYLYRVWFVYWDVSTPQHTTTTNENSRARVSASGGNSRFAMPHATIATANHFESQERLLIFIHCNVEKKRSYTPPRECIVFFSRTNCMRFYFPPRSHSIIGFCSGFLVQNELGWGLFLVRRVRKK